jgi:formyl-CoA transferase
LFRKLAAAMDRPDLGTDPRFATRAARVDNQDELYAILTAWVADQTADHAVKLLNDAGVPAAAIMNIADIAADPHYRERGTIVDVEDEEFGELPMAAPVPQMSKTPGRIRSLGPALGQHTDEVLSDLLALPPEQLHELHTAGVI